MNENKNYCYDSHNLEEDLSEEDLEMVLAEERIEACAAIVKEFQTEELEFEYKSFDDGSGTFYLMNSNPIRIKVLDAGHAEFAWFGNPLSCIIGTNALEDSTTLKSRISYKKIHKKGLSPFVEYSLLCVNENHSDFARSVALNALFFQADINAIVSQLKEDNKSVTTMVRWEGE